ncbi:hypothetical protein PRK78_004325 [Emydomyces testavorans]|uniref:Uncharacterized protein n=1 Tax=Emydomyces testavorans TaxID=2070801 RepID=A0AAF0IJF3_9EURO|nr:hypothetical protein PRK78_004325 [Emydomyces testavorans]
MALPKPDAMKIQLPTHILLAQVASSIKANAPTITTAIPAHSTWTAALSASMESLESDHELLVSPRRTEERREALKVMARSNTLLPPEQTLRSSEDRRPIRTPFAK